MHYESTAKERPSQAEIQKHYRFASQLLVCCIHKIRYQKHCCTLPVNLYLHLIQQAGVVDVLTRTKLLYPCSGYPQVTVLSMNIHIITLSQKHYTHIYIYRVDVIDQCRSPCLVYFIGLSYRIAPCVITYELGILHSIWKICVSRLQWYK